MNEVSELTDVGGGVGDSVGGSVGGCVGSSEEGGVGAFVGTLFCKMQIRKMNWSEK